MFQPFPCTVCFGLLKIRIGKNCLVLRRSDREFPHVTLFYEKRPGGSYWWPHVTHRLRGGREDHVELGRWDDGDVAGATRRLLSVAKPRFDALLRPVDVGDLTSSGWVAIVPSIELANELVGFMKIGRRILAMQHLIDLLHDDEHIEPLIECLFRHAMRPEDLPPHGPYPAFRVGDTGIDDEGFLYAYPTVGGPSWFLGPRNVFAMTSREFLELVSPGLIPALQRAAEALELPFPG